MTVTCAKTIIVTAYLVEINQVHISVTAVGFQEMILQVRENRWKHNFSAEYLTCNSLEKLLLYPCRTC